MPFYPTPDRDDGYDISDFYSVDPRLGTLGHFVEVVRTARDRGIRVIIDLVVNHASGHAAIVPRVVPGQRVAPDSHLD
jgi:glycosidase